MNKTKLFLASIALAASQAATAQGQKGPDWLEDAFFYQIYPSSYQDSDGNGIGDLQGIINRLDYIKSLGVNAIWLNPVFESGWFDGGYDVIDFYRIDPRFGTNTDMVRLTEEAHRRGIKVCLDLVAGHTSTRSEWFKQSASGDVNSRYADYYIWTDSISDQDKADIVKRHNSENPASNTTGKYVEANAKRAKYYLKNYFECQPALNYGYANPDPSHPWEQPVTAPGPQAVRRELRNIMSFWFDKGIDGFRVDLAASLVKNDPEKEAVKALWHEMREWKDRNYPQCVLISEWANPPLAIPAGFSIDFMLSFGVKGYASLFFDHATPWGQVKSGKTPTYDYCYFDLRGKGKLDEFITNYTNSYTKTKDRGYIAIPTCNHDFQRHNIGTRNTPEQLKVAMTFFLTMPGIPFIYYGDEIGMKYQENLPSKEGSNRRSGSRTPMQWTKGETAGFSTCKPSELYLPVDTDGGRITVETQDADPKSLVNYTRALAHLRHATPALNNQGDWQLISSLSQPYPMVYKRTLGKQTIVVALNPSGKTVKANVGIKSATKLLSTGKATIKKGTVTLGSCSAVVTEVEEL